MINIKKLTDMAYTEAIERGTFDDLESAPRINNKNLPALDYRLELIENPDGTLTWYE